MLKIIEARIKPIYVDEDSPYGTKNFHTITVKGNTYPIKDTLKELKFRWDPDTKKWVASVKNSEENKSTIIKNINNKLKEACEFNNITLINTYQSSKIKNTLYDAARRAKDFKHILEDYNNKLELFNKLSEALNKKFKVNVEEKQSQYGPLLTIEWKSNFNEEIEEIDNPTGRGNKIKAPSFIKASIRKIDLHKTMLLLDKIIGLTVEDVLVGGEDLNGIYEELYKQIPSYNKSIEFLGLRIELGGFDKIKSLHVDYLMVEEIIKLINKEDISNSYYIVNNVTKYRLD